MCKEIEHELSCIIISLLGGSSDLQNCCKRLLQPRGAEDTGSNERAPLSAGHLGTGKPAINHPAHAPGCVQGRGEARTIPGSSGARWEPGRAAQAARSPSVSSAHSSQPDNLDRATCEITAQGFPTSTSREEGLSTKTNTFHLWLLPVL